MYLTCRGSRADLPAKPKPVAPAQPKRFAARTTKATIAMKAARAANPAGAANATENANRNETQHAMTTDRGIEQPQMEMTTVV